MSDKACIAARKWLLGSGLLQIDFEEVETMVDGKYVIVGGSKGIGLGIVQRLVADGHEVVVMSRCLLYTSPSPRDQRGTRMPSSA